MDAAQLPWSRLKVEGKVPKELYGTLFRNGPAGFERGRARYQHWFDGDGLVHGFRLDGHGVRHHARKVATEKWKREAEAGRFLVSGAGSRIPDSVPSRGNDDGNPANISVVPWGEDLLALWEAGSPYALDPQTLKTRRRVTWSENADHLPFSAHPLFEKDGRMWNFGLAQWAGADGKLVLYELHPRRGLQRLELLDLPFPGYMHSFAMTERKLVFYVCPHVFERAEGRLYVDSHRWRPELGGQLLTVDKSDFSKRTWQAAPPGFIFHFADAQDLSGGGVRMRACWSNTPEIMAKEMRAVMCGEATGLGSPPEVVEIEARVGRDVAVRRTGLHGDFPAVDGRSPGGFLAVADDDRLQVLTPRGSNRTLRVPGEVLLEEHRFVARGGQAGDGWLLGTGYDLAARRSILTAFDLSSRETTPVFRATLKGRIPFGFHGWFVPS